MDTSLLKDPVFMIIGISNVFGMAGLYVPFVYLVDAAKESVSFDSPLKKKIDIAEVFFIKLSLFDKSLEFKH
jgi:hypothetical protein